MSKVMARKSMDGGKTRGRKKAPVSSRKVDLRHKLRSGPSCQVKGETLFRQKALSLSVSCHFYGIHAPCEWGHSKTPAQKLSAYVPLFSQLGKYYTSEIKFRQQSIAPHGMSSPLCQQAKHHLSLGRGALYPLRCYKASNPQGQCEFYLPLLQFWG